MRRWTAALVTALALALAGPALAGCSSPASGHDLTDGWPVLAAPTQFQPAVGACHETLDSTGSVDTYQPVPCAELHLAETFHVGRAPETPVAPAAGSAPSKQAYAECATEAATFLGGPWRGARLAVHLSWPSRRGWAGGARWFRCDLTEAELVSGDDKSRTGSLKGALKGANPLTLSCFNPKVSGSTVRTMTPVDCTSSHHAEFAGVWTAPEVSYAEQTEDRTRTAAGCRSTIAEFAGLPDDSNVQYRTGWISYNPTRTEWQLGERRVRCFLWLTDRPLSRSMKAAGPAALPVH